MDALFEDRRLTTQEIEAGMEYVLASPRDAGVLHLIVQRPAVNKRRVVETGTLDVRVGLVGDNWLTKGRWRPPRKG